MSLYSDVEPTPYSRNIKSENRMERNIKEGYWETRDGKKIPLKDLTESHKKNIERMFEIKL